jgi:osmotically-inducible protein OsmY
VHPPPGRRARHHQRDPPETARESPQELRQDVAAAFARHAQREAGHITVDIEGGVVTLSGTVGSLAERDAAIGTAYAARGVTRVIDQLQVA